MNFSVAASCNVASPSLWNHLWRCRLKISTAGIKLCLWIGESHQELDDFSSDA